MESGTGALVRADQIDLKSLDAQLERHLSRAWTAEKMKKAKGEGVVLREKPEWEIDVSKLVVKGAIARGTFGAVHRGIYDGLDVAGELLSLSLTFCPTSGVDWLNSNILKSSRLLILILLFKFFFGFSPAISSSSDPATLKEKSRCMPFFR